MRALNCILAVAVTSAAYAKDPVLRTKEPVLEFQMNEMHGSVRAVHHHHGLVVYGNHNNQPVTKHRMCTMNLEHYVAAGIHGQFVPRKTELQSYKRDELTLTIHFAPTDEWKVESALQYDFRNPDFIDVTFTFKFGADYEDFEAFVASYMQSYVPPLIKRDGAWVRFQPERNQQMFLPKTEAHGEMVFDGRWSWFSSRLVPARIEGVYELPVMVTRDEDTGYALVQLIDPRECMALSINNFAPAHDVSLIGHDVKAGQTVTVPVRIHYRKIERLAEVEELYKRFCEDRGIPN